MADAIAAAMLPAKNVEIRCFQCRRRLAAGDESCTQCGVSRDVSLAAHGELTPAIVQLRVLLAVVTALATVLALVTYDHHRHDGDGFAAALPFIITGVAYGGMLLLVSRFPLAVGIFGASGIVLQWAQASAHDPGAMFDVLPGGVRVVLVAGFGIVIQAVRRYQRLSAATSTSTQ